jgi:hypothetical protein
MVLKLVFGIKAEVAALAFIEEIVYIWLLLGHFLF